MNIEKSVGDAISCCSATVGVKNGYIDSNALALAFRDQSAPVSKIVELIMTNCMGRNMSTREMANLFCVSQRTFTRRMKAEGQSFRVILQDVRRKSAEKLLLTTDAPVSEISRILGYSDTSNFTKAFKGWSGVCPKVFKRNNA